MKQSASISTVLSLMLVVTSWVTPRIGKFAPIPAASASTETCQPVGWIASIQGQVTLKRQEWSDYQPTARGAELCLGDLLRPAPGASVTVQCAASQNLWRVSAGRISGAAQGCPPPQEPLYRRSGPLTPPRSETARRIPYIISPSFTRRLDDRPTLRWMPVEGANRYKVRVSGAGVSGEPEFVSTTEIVYSGESLERGESYLLTVEADIGEEPASATFIPIAQEKAQRLRDAAEQLAQTDLTDEEQALALANLYIGQGLIPDAIDLLEPIAKRGSQMAAIHYTLGELYAAVELLEPAEEYYSQAVELAASANNLEGQAAAAARLGEICAVRGNSDMAKRWFEKALAGYKALGDRQRVQELEQKQRKLETEP